MRCNFLVGLSSCSWRTFTLMIPLLSGQSFLFGLGRLFFFSSCLCLLLELISSCLFLLCEFVD